MRIPRWVWCLLGIVAAIVAAVVSTLYVLMFCWISSIEAYERPQPFEEKVQFTGAAVWISGTQARSSDGDACTSKYNLQFARTKHPRENVEAIESRECSTSFILYKVGWFAFGNGTYLRVGDEIYWRVSQERWRKRSADWKNGWSLNRIEKNKGQIICERATKERIFHHVFQLPQKVGGKWVLIARKSSPRKRSKTPNP